MGGSGEFDMMMMNSKVVDGTSSTRFYVVD